MRGDPAALPAAEVLAIAEGRRPARPLLEPDPSDHPCVRADAPEISLGKLEAGLVYAASGSVVDTTVVAGEVLMEGGVVPAPTRSSRRPARRRRGSASPEASA